MKGIISVDISEWEKKGLNGKAAKQCTSEEIKTEVWEQLKRSLNYGDNVLLKDEHLHRWSLDPDIRIHRRPRGHDRQRGAVAGESDRHLEAPAGGGDEDSEPVPGVGLRAHQHRSGDDGGGQ